MTFKDYEQERDVAIKGVAELVTIYDRVGHEEAFSMIKEMDLHAIACGLNRIANSLERIERSKK